MLMLLTGLNLGLLLMSSSDSEPQETCSSWAILTIKNLESNELKRVKFPP